MEDKLKEIMAKVLTVPMDSLTQDSSIENIPSWDSLRHMNLIVAIEEGFQVEFEEEDITELTMFKKIISTLEKRLG